MIADVQFLSRRHKRTERGGMFTVYALIDVAQRDRAAWGCLTSSIHVVGTAPFCAGKCPIGEETLGYQNEGENGDKCTTG